MELDIDFLKEAYPEEEQRARARLKDPAYRAKAMRIYEIRNRKK